MIERAPVVWTKGGSQSVPQIVMPLQERQTAAVFAAVGRAGFGKAGRGKGKEKTGKSTENLTQT